MTLLAVGRPYIPGTTSLPEAIQYNWRDGGHELLMWLRSPTRAEVRDITKGAASFGLLVDQSLLVLLYRLGDIDGDAPYSYWMAHGDGRSAPPPAEMAEPHALLSIVLVDASTGLVQGLRGVTFSPAFTARLHLAIQAQAAAPTLSREDYDRAAEELYRRYPTTAAMWAAASITTRGGR